MDSMRHGGQHRIDAWARAEALSVTAQTWLTAAAVADTGGSA